MDFELGSAWFYEELLGLKTLPKTQPEMIELKMEHLYLKVSSYVDELKLKDPKDITLKGLADKQNYLAVLLELFLILLHLKPQIL